MSPRARNLMSMSRAAASAVGVSVVFLAAAEGTARIQDGVRFGVPLTAAPAYEDLLLFEDTGIRGRPHGRYRTWQLNGFGFRGGEMAVLPDPGCARVMVLGASETFGTTESAGMEYPAQLASRLKSAGCYEVVNAALAGLTLHSITRLWDEWFSRFRPSIVVVYPTPAFYLADPPPSAWAPRTPAPPRPWWTPRLMDRARDVVAYPAWLRRQRAQRSLADARRQYPSSWMFDGVPTERLHEFLADLDTLVCKVSASGARPILVTHAVAFRRPPAADQLSALESWNTFAPRATAETMLAFEAAAAAAMVARAAERRADVVDAARAMGGERRWFAGDLIHFSDEGAGVLAGLIAKAVTAAPQLAVARTDGPCVRRETRALQ